MGKKGRGGAAVPTAARRRDKKVDDAGPSDGSSRSRPQTERNTGDGAAAASNRPGGLPGFLIVALVLPSILTMAARLLGASPAFAFRLSPEDGDRPHFLLRLVLSVLLDATYSGALCAILLPPSRALARRLPGASVPPDAGGCEEQEAASDDPSLVWPVPGTHLPREWVEAAATKGEGGGGRKGQQQQQQQQEGGRPFFLNHVRGSTRIRHATYRVAAALGTVLMVAVMSRYVDRTPLSAIGLELSPPDLVRGFAVGAGVIVALFAAEVGLGWIRVVGYLETVAPAESLPVNLAWDVLFHVGVSISEEISMRGWILVNTAQYVASSLGATAHAAMLTAVALQSGLFALMHLGSPGATRVGLLNLVVGGTAAALNVFLSGGLSFSLGWHFGWNITMGHLLGLSTSGIPMSAKLVSVVPHPRKAHLHGGRFGPEQSPLAPVAYLLGCVALVYLYGTEGLSVWSERLG